MPFFSSFCRIWLRNLLVILNTSFTALRAKSGVSIIGSASYVTGSTFSNTASLWLFGDFLFSAFGSGNASGNLNVYLEISPDGGTTWPSPVSANGAGAEESMAS